MSRRIGLFGSIVAVGLCVTACSSSPSASPSSSPSPSRATPSAVILSATRTSLAQSSADIGMHVNATVGARSVGIAATGTADLANSAMQLAMTVQGVPQLTGASLSVVVVDGTTYLSYPGISTALPGKTWVSQPTSASNSSGLQVSNVADMLRILAAKGATVTKVGVGAIGSTPVTAYNVSISPSLIAGQSSTLGVPQADLAEVQQILGSSGVTFKVYVNPTGQLRRLTLHMVIPASSSSPAVQESVVVDFTNYGTPVSVTAPPSNQVASLQQLQAVAA